MQRLAKEGFLLAFVVASLILLAFALLMPTNTITNVSAVYSYRVGVYEDSDCTDPVLRIPWGNLTPGSSKSKIVYVKNENPEPIYLTLNKTNWTPPEASLYMTLRWDYTWQRMNPNETLQITLTLSAYSSIKGISSFSFDIVIGGTDRLPGDVNGDGRVTGLDILIVMSIYNFMQTVPPANPYADVNGDGRVTGLDITIIAKIENFMRP